MLCIASKHQTCNLKPHVFLPLMTLRIATTLFLALLLSTSAFAQDKHKARTSVPAQTAGVKSQSIRGAKVVCQNGFASGYPCQLADLHAFVSVFDLNPNLHDSAFDTNDIWGWTDPENGNEYVLIGMRGGTSMVNITDTENPVVLGFLPTHSSSSIWRDIKVYNDHAFIVSEAASHGMQVFDLTQLRNVASPPILFQESAHYDGMSSAHNVAINEETGFAYIVGANGGGDTCGGGLHMVNIQNPLVPQFVGCFSDLGTSRGYSHDAQCVIYSGPDADYQGKEICVGSNEDKISVADVTDKANPVAISQGGYPLASYVHQGWFTEDQRYFILGDELDEMRRGNNTKTIIWDLVDLDDPVVLTEYIASTPVIDHNQYVKGDYVFQSNYTGGLHILDISDPANPVEVSYFDTVPNHNNVGFDGSWSNYPFFESGIIAVSSQLEGLFLVESVAVETAVEQPELPAQLTLSAPYPNPFDDHTALTLTVEKAQRTEVVAYDMLGRQVAVLFEGMILPDTPQVVTFDAKNFPNGKYIVRATGDSAALSRVVTLIR